MLKMIPTGGGILRLFADTAGMSFRYSCRSGETRRGILRGFRKQMRISNNQNLLKQMMLQHVLII